MRLRVKSRTDNSARYPRSPNRCCDLRDDLDLIKEDGSKRRLVLPSVELACRGWV